METLPTDIKTYIEYLCYKNKHLEHIKSLNEEFKNKFLNKMLPPFLLLKQTIHNKTNLQLVKNFLKESFLNIHDEYSSFSCYYIENENELDD